MRTQVTVWYIEFGQEQGKGRKSFGPFRTREAAKAEVQAILEDNPNFFRSGYKIQPRDEWETQPEVL